MMPFSLSSVGRTGRLFTWLVPALLGFVFGALEPASRSNAQEPPARPQAIGVIGLDTSHAVAFTRLIQSDAPPYDRFRVTLAYPRGSADIESSVSRIPQYTQQMRELGVEIADSLEELIEQVDVVLLETNDGRPHLEQVLPVLRAGKPVFVDKPLAASLADVMAIQMAAEHFRTPLFSSSSLRFAPEALAARSGEAVGQVLGAATYSPAKREATHPDFYWYGIHGVEQLFTVMGPGCQAVTRTTTPTTDLVIGRWSDGRLGTFRGFREGPAPYGGTVFGERGQASSGGNPGYTHLVTEILKFFESGQSPVSSSETLEIYAFMTAADRCLEAEAGTEVALADVLAPARREATARLRALGLVEFGEEPPSCRQTEDEIILQRGSREVLRYALTVRPPPGEMDPVFSRSGYLHPLRTPSGRIVSGDFSPDHAHQHGVFLAWVNCQLGGRDLDFWNQAKRLAGVRHQQVLQLDPGPEPAGFQVELVHEDLTGPQPRLVIREHWQVLLRSGEPNCHVVDLVSQQRLETRLPLVLKRHVYGGLGVRGSNLWTRPGAAQAFQSWQKDPRGAPPGSDVMGHAFLTSQGKARHDGNHTPARWAAIYGEVDGQLAGLAVLDHPRNFRHPQGVRLHPSMPYFSYTPVWQQGFQIEPGQRQVARYRLVMFDGPPDPDFLDQQWAQFAQLADPEDPWQPQSQEVRHP